MASNPPGSGSGTSADRPGTQFSERAQATAQRLKDTGREQLEARKSGAADQGEAVASAVDRAAEQLRGTNPTLADYAHGLSRGIANAAQQVRERSVDDLLADAQSLARRNPTLFILGSVGLGVALSRFLKASGNRANDAAASASGYSRPSGYSRRSSPDLQGESSHA